jgi:hypothetical protein
MKMIEEYPLLKRWSIGVLTLLAAADVDKVVTTTAMIVGAYSIDAQPGVPSRISVSQTAVGTADTPGTITVVGTNDLDEVISEVIIPVAGSVVYGLLYFKTVTSVTGAGWVIDVGAGNDTITVGVSKDSEIIVQGQNIVFINVSGNIYVNPKTIASAANGLLLAATETLTLAVRDSLSIVADGSGGTFKYIIPEN